MTDHTETVTIEQLIHWASLELKVNGYMVEQFEARHHGPTHIAVNGVQIIVLFCRPSGGKLLAQHRRPFEHWTRLASHDPQLQCLLLTPDDRSALKGVIDQGVDP